MSDNGLLVSKSELLAPAADILLCRELLPIFAAHISYPGIATDPHSLDELAQRIWQAGQLPRDASADHIFARAIAGLTAQEWSAINDRHLITFGCSILPSAIPDGAKGICHRLLHRDAESIYLPAAQVKSRINEDFYLNLAKTHNLGQKFLMQHSDLGDQPWYRFSGAVKEQFLNQAESSMHFLTQPSVAKRLGALSDKMTEAVTLLWGSLEILHEEEQAKRLNYTSAVSASVHDSTATTPLISKALWALKSVASELRSC